MHMNTLKEDIYQTLLHSGRMTVSEIMERLQQDNQPYVSRLLGQLRDEQRVAADKDGRNVYYYTVDVNVGLEENLQLSKLPEDIVWQKVTSNQDFASSLNERTESILYFAFSEMLNNAIDHSRSNVGYVKIWREDSILKFIVKDNGIGVFRNFMTKKHLPDETTAMQELIKGKQTTAPRRHSGEGIFWTSKIADAMSLRSYDYELKIDNRLGDYAILHLEQPVIGTEVYFEIDARTNKSLQKLFEKYALNHQSYSFDTTEIPVKLFDAGDVWISRSQAKRIMEGLDKYKKIILDFKGIDFIGQGFADEIFRVFEIAHPDIIIESINMSQSVAMMVQRTREDQLGRQ